VSLPWLPRVAVVAATWRYRGCHMAMTWHSRGNLSRLYFHKPEYNNKATHLNNNSSINKSPVH
jgi:hypothetical protein